MKKEGGEDWDLRMDALFNERFCSFQELARQQHH